MIPSKKILNHGLLKLKLLKEINPLLLLNLKMNSKNSTLKKSLLWYY